MLCGAVAIGVGLALIALVLAYPNLPSLEILTDYRPKIPLRVYTSDGYLIGEFGEERRAVIGIQDVPPVMKQAILAAEDDRFYQHGGVDYLGIARAAFANLAGGGAIVIFLTLQVSGPLRPRRFDAPALRIARRAFLARAPPR